MEQEQLFRWHLLVWPHNCGLDTRYCRLAARILVAILGCSRPVRRRRTTTTTTTAVRVNGHASKKVGQVLLRPYTALAHPPPILGIIRPLALESAPATPSHPPRVHSDTSMSPTHPLLPLVSTATQPDAAPTRSNPYQKATALRSHQFNQQVGQSAQPEIRQSGSRSKSVSR